VGKRCPSPIASRADTILILSETPPIAHFGRLKHRVGRRHRLDLHDCLTEQGFGVSRPSRRRALLVAECRTCRPPWHHPPHLVPPPENDEHQGRARARSQTSPRSGIKRLRGRKVVRKRRLPDKRCHIAVLVAYDRPALLGTLVSSFLKSRANLKHHLVKKWPSSELTIIPYPLLVARAVL